MADVVCLGILVADVLGKPVDEYPGRGKLVLCDQMELHTGGCATNTGISLAKIGIDTGIMGKVGQDGFGDFVIKTVESHGMDARGVARDPENNTSGTMVMIHGDGERSFIHYLGANATLVEDDINYEYVEGAKVLHVAGTFLMPAFDGQPTANVLKKALEMGITTSLDTAWDSRGRWMELLAPCLPYMDYFVPSIEEARMVTGMHDPADVARALMDRGVKVVGLKMGEDGCYIRSAGAEVRIPKYDVDAVDACGAGDAFAAGFLTGIVKGWDLEMTGRFANAVGACCVTAIGATTGIKSLEQTLAFMESHR